MSKCRIFIPERGTANELTIQVVGPAQGLKLANKMIQGILNKREEEQKQWEERREKEQEAEENGENPDLLDIDPECLQYLKPSSKMVVSLDIN
jgi:UDP-N-acetylglucosamine:LPS N-acetylglucosamine transferase